MPQPPPSQAQRGFTLLELLVIIAVVAVLVILCFPALAGGKVNSKTAVCMANNRSLVLAWQMYAEDNTGNLPFSSPKNTSGDSATDPGCWAYGALDYSPANRANWDPNYSIMPGVLWAYARSTNIYRCPADPVTLNVSGQPRPRVRTMAMNIWVGGWYPDENAVYTGLPSGLASVPLTNWTVFRKVWQVNSATGGGGSGIFVFLDMRPDSADLPNFGICMDGYPAPGVSAGGTDMYRFWDMPGIQHAGACTFSFADGHTEIRKWKDPRTLVPLTAPPASFNDTAMSPGNMDIGWIQERATRPHN